MKTKLLSLAAIIAIAFFSNTMTAQTNSATATATATIVTPLTIVRTAHMNFGNVSAGASGGTVQLSPAGVRTPSGTVQLAATNTGTVSAAIFTVSGQGAYTYSITLPSTDLTITNTTGLGGETMIVNAFTSTPSSTGTLAAGTQTLNVGATLGVTAAQVAGVYVSATPFPVTVNYN